MGHAGANVAGFMAVGRCYDVQRLTANSLMLDSAALRQHQPPGTRASPRPPLPCPPSLLTLFEKNKINTVPLENPK